MAMHLPPLVQDDVLADPLDHDDVDVELPPGLPRPLRFEISSYLNSHEDFAERLLISPANLWNRIFEPKQIPLEHFKTLDNLIHVATFMAVIANCDIREEEDRDVYKNKIVSTSKLKQITLLESLGKHGFLE